MRMVLVVGATSAIAKATARMLAADRDRLFLVARDERKLHVVAQDLAVRGADRVETHVADFARPNGHDAIVERAVAALGGLDTAILAHGTLGEQQRCQNDSREAEEVIRVNFLSAVALLTPLANRFEEQGRGTILVISSVAGDRGRQSNYVYGSAKGALSIFLQGLRNRLHPKGVRVITVKPGFVDTPMTAHMKKGPLFARAEDVAAGVYRALGRGGDVVYLPRFWRPIMTVIRAVPERIFKRLKL